MSQRYAKLAGWGKYVPEKVLANAELAKMVNTTSEAIFSLTGIRERRIRGENEQASDFSVNAALPALRMAEIDPKELDLIIVATSTPDYPVPGVSTIVQHKLGAQCGAFQLTIACAGWVYALVTATQFIQSGSMKNILVIGADVVSTIIDSTDRGTAILFGDASAAVVLQPSDQPAGVMAFELGSDGSKTESLYYPAGGTVFPFATDGEQALKEKRAYLKMDGQAVYMFATRTLANSLKRVVDKAGLTVDDVQLFIPHQANARLIESGARMMKQPLDKFYMNIEKYGNTSAASVPLALVEALEEGRCQLGDKVAVCAFGAGLSWASAVLQL